MENYMKTIYLIFISLLFLTVQNFAQSTTSTTIKLPTTDNTSSFNITNSSNAVRLKINADGGFYLAANSGSSTIPIEGEGIRLMWYPWKAAFRAGYACSTQWDDSTIGTYSTATGYCNKASGISSTAIGFGTTASGTASTAMGQSTTASGSYSTAMGYASKATDTYSFACGFSAHATGNSSIAIGNNTRATGDYSTALGNKISTNNREGSFIIGDNSGSSVHNSSAANQMTMRFDGGYRLFTSSAFSSSQCAFLNANANSWSTTSDSTKKEKFIKADEEYFLNSISRLRLGSWNYKNQTSKECRHYGPMAQEIFHYFGKDELGVIGNDTTLASADMDGIIMICLQALEKRTSELKIANDENNFLKQKVENLEKTLSEQQILINNFKNDFNELKNAVYNQSKQRDELKTEFTVNK